MLLSHLLSTGLATLMAVTLVWLLSLYLRDSSIVDIFWGLGFVLVAGVTFARTAAPHTLPQWLLLSMVTLWGGRLALHIYARNHGRGEDFRYQQFRTNAGPKYWWSSYLTVFLLQGALLWLIAHPLVYAFYKMGTRAPQPTLYAVGFLLWGVGFFFEAVGDWQLRRFKQNPANKGKVLDKGLWAYTRHPNYFGDALLWWGYFAIASAVGGWWTLYAPLVMTGLLLKVSGVAMLERTLAQTKPQYADYIARTNAFFPWFPRS